MHFCLAIWSLYMWKESCKQQGKDQFNELLNIFSMKQQEEDKGHSDGKVKDNL